MKLNYEVIEHNLETCSIMSRHYFNARTDGSILIETYDINNDKEGYQYYIEKVGPHQYSKYWESSHEVMSFHKKLIDNRAQYKFLHVAFDNEDNLVKIDFTIGPTSIKRIASVFKGFELSDHVIALSKEFFLMPGSWIYVQIYDDGSKSMEFPFIYDTEGFLKYCLERELLNEKQIDYCKKFSGKIFSIKFKWVDSKIQKKLYYRNSLTPINNTRR